MHPYDMLHLSSTDLVAHVGPCLFVISHALSLEGVEAIARGLAKLSQRYTKVCSMAIVERKSGPGTTPEAREAIAELTRKHDKNISGAVVICEGTGFRATAIRSVVTAIHMASRASHPTKVFPSPEPALEWLQSTRPERDLDLALLTQATVALRARLQDQVARAAAAQTGV